MWKTLLLATARLPFRARLLRCAVVAALAQQAIAMADSPTAAGSALPQWIHAHAAFGQPKYPPGFAHFDYVNPDAPTGGTINLRNPDRRSSFDKFNPFTTKGNSPAGLGIFMFESLRAALQMRDVRRAMESIRSLTINVVALRISRTGSVAVAGSADSSMPQQQRRALEGFSSAQCRHWIMAGSGRGAQLPFGCDRIA